MVDVAVIVPANVAFPLESIKKFLERIKPLLKSN